MKKTLWISLSLLFAILLFAQTAKVFTVNSAKCIGCTLCVRACPVQAISMVERKAVIDQAKCTHCGNCETRCPVRAISHAEAPVPDSTHKPVAEPPDSRQLRVTESSDPTVPLAEPRTPTPDPTASAPRETIVLDVHYEIGFRACTGCTVCRDVCPTKAISMKNGRAIIDQSKCIHCGQCDIACPFSAIDKHTTSLKERL